MRPKEPTNISPEEFELVVKEILEATSGNLIGFSTVHREKLETYDGVYEIDITARFEALGAEFLVLVECKHHREPIKREAVQVLYDRLRSTNAQKGMLFSTAGFQSGAMKYAKKHGIALIHVVEGKSTYETRGVGGPFEPPPWANIPSYVGWLTMDGRTYSMISHSDPEVLNEFLFGTAFHP